MNKSFYWDEYVNQYLDDKQKKRNLKFYLDSFDDYLVDKKDVDDEFLNYWKNRLNFQILPDIYIDKYKLSNMPSQINELSKGIKRIYRRLEKKIVILPVLIVYDDNFLDDGIYFFDVFNEYIIKYKEIDSSKEDLKKGIMLLFYLNIDQAIVCFKKSAYTKGVIQVGMIKQEIDSIFLKNNYYEEDIIINRQRVTHKIGINMRKELLIDYSLWRMKV